MQGVQQGIHVGAWVGVGVGVNSGVGVGVGSGPPPIQPKIRERIKILASTKNTLIIFMLFIPPLNVHICVMLEFPHHQQAHKYA